MAFYSVYLLNVWIQDSSPLLALLQGKKKRLTGLKSNCDGVVKLIDMDVMMATQPH